MHVRCTVQSMNYSACGMRMGDTFDIEDDRVRVPESGFCYHAIAAVLPSIYAWAARRATEEDAPTELLVTCPDPPEGMRMKVVTVNAEDS